MAKNSFSIAEYFSSVAVNVREANAMELSDPMGPWDNTNT